MKRINLVYFRMKRGLKQREMAELLNVSKNHYCNIELGIFDPSYKLMKKFREEFPDKNVDVWDVFEKEEEKDGASVE